MTAPDNNNADPVTISIPRTIAADVLRGILHSVEYYSEGLAENVPNIDDDLQRIAQLKDLFAAILAQAPEANDDAWI